jgi:hypothetical protein
MKIVLGDLKKMKDEIMPFLEKKLSTKPSFEDDVLTFEENDNKRFNIQNVKTYLKRFLHNNGLRDSYRILVNQRTIKMVKISD